MNKVQKRVNKSFFLIVMMVVSMLFSGCASQQGSTKVVLMTGFHKDEVFRIEEISCTLPEMMVYLTNTQNQYESVFGTEIWERDLEGITLEESVKEIVLAKVAQIKTMNLLAEDYQVYLDESELEKVAQAAETYEQLLTDYEKEILDVDKETIQIMYEEYARADKVYDYLIKDINPEISDDEARTITVQHILIKTYAKDGTGTKIEYSEEEKQKAYQRAVTVLQKVKDTENYSFEELVREYNEDSVSTYSFRKGEMDPVFEETAFCLEKGECSDIIETEYGYHIIKCLNTFDRDETEKNKMEIVETRKKEVFGEKYDIFVEKLARKLNEKLWKEIYFIHDENVTTADFYKVYNQYFQ